MQNGPDRESSCQNVLNLTLASERWSTKTSSKPDRYCFKFSCLKNQWLCMDNYSALLTIASRFHSKSSPYILKRKSMYVTERSSQYCWGQFRIRHCKTVRKILVSMLRYQNSFFSIGFANFTHYIMENVVHVVANVSWLYFDTLWWERNQSINQ